MIGVLAEAADTQIKFIMLKLFVIRIYANPVQKVIQREQLKGLGIWNFILLRVSLLETASSIVETKLA